MLFAFDCHSKTSINKGIDPRGCTASEFSLTLAREGYAERNVSRSVLDVMVVMAPVCKVAVTAALRARAVRAPARRTAQRVDLKGLASLKQGTTVRDYSKAPMDRGLGLKC